MNKPDKEVYIATPDKPALKVRAEASFEADVVRLLMTGSTVEVLEVSEDGWAKVSDGYVFAAYLGKEDKDDGQEPEPGQEPATTIV